MLVIVSAFLLLLIVGIIYIHNKLIRNRNRVEEAWHIIDVLLQRRHDLIPLLVDIVKGYTKHEVEMLENITHCRTLALSTRDSARSIILSENKLDKALDQLHVVSEAYPTLKASDHFLKLQKQLAFTETELGRARRYYNAVVSENNIYQEKFPSNLIASMFGFSKNVFYNLESTSGTNSLS